MRERTEVGALSLIAASLCLAALAHLRDSAPPVSLPTAQRPTAVTTPSIVRALRDGERIDLNRAEAADLELLPGIGPALAQRIIEDKRTHGDFASIGELVRVRGIGPRTLERLQALVQVQSPGQGRAPTPASAPSPASAP